MTGITKDQSKAEVMKAIRRYRSATNAVVLRPSRENLLHDDAMSDELMAALDRYATHHIREQNQKINELEELIRNILYHDERGQGPNFSAAMKRAEAAVGYDSKNPASYETT